MIMKIKLSHSLVRLFVFSLFSAQLYAQGDPNFRQNQLNILQLNPAQAGSNPYSELICFASNQWLGIPGAPKTFLTSGNFNIRNNFGLGATILGDENGPVNLTRAEVSLAYHLKLTDKWKFALGVKMGVTNMTVNLNELTIINQEDPLMKGILRTGINFNAGFGGLFYSKKYYLGFSVPNVASTKFLNRDMSEFVDTRFGQIIYVGGTFKLDEKLQLRPNIVYRSIKGTPLNLDFNALLTYNKKFDIGLTHQFRASLGTILGMQTTDNLYLAYSYTYPINSLNLVTFQSHELALRYRIIKKSERPVNPRYFI
jgi:type IX secretion system PorP/SprF family membrane protein